MKKVSVFNLLMLVASVFILGCNNSENKTDTTTTDTTANTMVTDTTAQTPTLDATVVAPAQYKVLKDSMGLRVLEINYKPGDSSALHAHPAVALYVIDGGKGEFTGKDGSKNVLDLKSGMAVIQGSTTHSVKNVGTTTLKAILVEVNRPDQSGATLDPKMDASKVASALYKVVADSMNIRVLIATYKPGASSAQHFHADNAIYVAQGGKAEFTMPDGTKQVATMDKGMVAIAPGSAHAVKNVGSTTTKVVIVEVNRPQH